MLKLEVRRQSELDEMRRQLDTLRRSQILSSDIDNLVERRVYEAEIRKLRNKVIELEEVQDKLMYEREELMSYGARGRGPWDQPVYAHDVQQMRETIEILRIQNSDLNEDLIYAQGQVTELQYKCSQLHSIIEQQKENLFRAEQLIDQRKKERDDLRYALEQFRRDQDVFRLRSPQVRDFTNSYRSQGSIERGDLRAPRFSRERIPEVVSPSPYRHRPQFSSASRPYRPSVDFMYAPHTQYISGNLNLSCNQRNHRNYHSTNTNTRKKMRTIR